MTRWMAALLALGVLAGSLVGCSTVPKSFNPVEPISPKDFSHQALDETLRVHVADGVVNYPAIAGDSKFQTYLMQLDRVDPNNLPTQQDRLAFWINAYNAFAIKGILDGYSPMTLFGRYRYFIARDNDPTRNQFDRQQKIARLSMIFHWFREDFEAHSGSLVNYVKRYVADPDLARELEAIPYKVEFLEYDWRLNGPPPREIPEHARPS